MTYFFKSKTNIELDDNQNDKVHLSYTRPVCLGAKDRPWGPDDLKITFQAKLNFRIRYFVDWIQPIAVDELFDLIPVSDWSDDMIGWLLDTFQQWLIVLNISLGQWQLFVRSFQILSSDWLKSHFEVKQNDLFQLLLLHHFQLLVEVGLCWW